MACVNAEIPRKPVWGFVGSQRWGGCRGGHSSSTARRVGLDADSGGLFSE